MTQPPSKPSKSPKPHISLDPARLAQLRAEAKAPFRGLRQFFYIAFAGAGALGGFIFLLKLLAGEEPATTVPNLLLQIGILGLMVWLLRVDSDRSS